MRWVTGRKRGTGLGTDSADTAASPVKGLPKRSKSEERFLKDSKVTESAENARSYFFSKQVQETI